MAQKKVFLGLRIRPDTDKKLQEMQDILGYPDKNTTASIALETGLNLYKAKRRSKL